MIYFREEIHKPLRISVGDFFLRKYPEIKKLMIQKMIDSDQTHCFVKAIECYESLEDYIYLGFILYNGKIEERLTERIYYRTFFVEEINL